MLLSTLLELITFLGLAVSTWFYVAHYFGARRFFARRGTAHADAQTPAVTVLKPLKGSEPDLYENLATFCQQDYPQFQLLFGVADAHDPAVAVVRRLQAAFPHVRSDLVIDERVYGTNHKISNLHNLYRHAAHDVIVLADSDIRVSPDYLRQLTRPLVDAKVGVVTCMYRARHSGDLPSRVEALFVNTDFAPSILVARMVETMSYAFGASIAIRRGVLDEIGGFLALSNYLADDFFLGNRTADAGYQVALSDLVVETVLPPSTWASVIGHQLRWARTYRSVRGWSYFAMALSHGVLWAAVNVMLHPSSTVAWAASLGLCALRVATASAVARRYLHAPFELYDALLVLPKDVLAVGVWLGAFLGNSVHWSGRNFRILPDGQMVRADPQDRLSVALPAYRAREERESL